MLAWKASVGTSLDRCRTHAAYSHIRREHQMIKDKHDKNAKLGFGNVRVFTKKLLWMPAKAREGFNSSDTQPSLDR